RDHVPDLGPHFAARSTERPRMLLPEDLGVRIVVEDDAVGTPIEHDRKARPEADAERAAQALGPGLDRTERGARPVVSADARANLAAAYEPVRCQRPRGFH